MTDNVSKYEIALTVKLSAKREFRTDEITKIMVTETVPAGREPVGFLKDRVLKELDRKLGDMQLPITGLPKEAC